MIDIKILGKKYSLPSCREISINKFVEFLEFCDDNQPDSIKEGTVGDTMEDAAYYANELQFWTGCVYSDIRKHPISEIYGVWRMQQEQLFCNEQLDYNCFCLDHDIYYLPKRGMQDSTIEDFAEANEYEKQFAELKNGIYSALPKIAAVLCRRSGETFDSYNVEERAELFGKELTAWDAFQIGFFLLRQSEKFSKDFQIYTASMTIAQLKQALKS